MSFIKGFCETIVGFVLLNCVQFLDFTIKMKQISTVDICRLAMYVSNLDELFDD
jgi:hypothetical protein